MKSLLNEVVAQQSAKRVLLDKINSLSLLFKMLKETATELNEKHEPKIVRRIIGTRKANWFIDNYLGSRASGYGLKEAVSELARQIKNHPLLVQLSTLPVVGLKGDRVPKGFKVSDNFAKVETLLPTVAGIVGKRLNDPSVAKAGEQLSNSMSTYYSHLERLFAGQDDSDDEIEQPKPKENVLGKQNQAVEQAVNMTLERLPQSVRGDIRTAIARAPNKLLRLRDELQKRGIKLESKSPLLKGALVLLEDAFQGYTQVSDFDEWKAMAEERGADFGNQQDELIMQYGTGAYRDDGVTVVGFWYPELGVGVILDKPAVATDPNWGMFKGLPPAFDETGNLLRH